MHINKLTARRVRDMGCGGDLGTCTWLCGGSELGPWKSRNLAVLGSSQMYAQNHAEPKAAAAEAPEGRGRSPFVPFFKDRISYCNPCCFGLLSAAVINAIHYSFVVVLSVCVCLLCGICYCMCVHICMQKCVQLCM